MHAATDAKIGATSAPLDTTGTPLDTTGALTVIRGLDPRIETGRQTARLDGRVKPGHDVGGESEGKRNVEGCFPP